MYNPTFKLPSDKNTAGNNLTVGTHILETMEICYKYRDIVNIDCSHNGSHLERWLPLNISKSFISSSNQLRIMIPNAKYTFLGSRNAVVLLLRTWMAAILDSNEVILRITNNFLINTSILLQMLTFSQPH